MLGIKNKCWLRHTAVFCHSMEVSSLQKDPYSKWKKGWPNLSKRTTNKAKQSWNKKDWEM